MSNTARNMLAWLRGGNSPVEIALAVGLGVTAGFTTGWNLFVLAIVVTVLSFRLHLATFLAAWFLGTAVGWLMMPLSVSVGQYLLEHSIFASLPAALGDHYWVVLLDLDRYAMCGGLTLGSFSGIGLGVLAWKLVCNTHLRSLRDESSNPLRTRRGFWRLHRVIEIWLNIDPDNHAAKSEETTFGASLKANWAIALPLSLVLAIVVLGYFVPRSIERNVMEELTRLNGAPVTASRIEVSLHDREIKLQDVRFADPHDPTVERLRIGRAKARLRMPANALRGVWYLEDVMLDDLRLSSSPAVTNRDLPSPGDSQDETIEPELATDSTGTFELPLDRYAPDIKELVRHMSHVETTTALARRMEQYDTPTDNHSSGWWGRRLASRELRSRTGSMQPRLVVEQLWVKQLPPSWQLGPTASLRVDRIASRWDENDAPAHLSIHAPAVAMQLDADLRVGEATQVHDIQCRFTNLRLVELIGPVTNEDRLTAYGGEVTLEVQGRAMDDSIDLFAEVETENPRLRVLGQEPWCGISPELWNRGFAEFDSFESRFQVLGTWQQPVVRVDAHQLQRQLKHQLAAYGITEQAPEAAQPVDGAEEVLPQMANAPTEDAMLDLPEDNTPPTEPGLATGNDYTSSDVTSSDELEEPALSEFPLPDEMAAGTGSYAADEYDPLPYTDYSTNPLTGMVPPQQGLPLPQETLPPPAYEQPLAAERPPVEDAAPPEAMAATSPVTTGLANPLRPAMPFPQSAAPEYPAYADPLASDAGSPYGAPTETYTSEEPVVDVQLALPEAVVENAPGPINFEQGYDQSWLPPIDLEESEPTPPVEQVAQSTAEPPVESKKPRRPGRISRWTKSVTSRVRDLWPGGDEPGEELASDHTDQYGESVISGSDPLEDDPVLQARRENEFENSLPWYRRLW